LSIGGIISPSFLRKDSRLVLKTIKDSEVYMGQRGLAFPFEHLVFAGGNNSADSTSIPSILFWTATVLGLRKEFIIQLLKSFDLSTDFVNYVSPPLLFFNRAIF
jgi:hypothetical protein